MSNTSFFDISIIKIGFDEELSNQSSFLYGKKGNNNFNLDSDNVSDKDELHLSYSQHYRKNDELCGIGAIRNWNRLSKRAEIYVYEISKNKDSSEALTELYVMLIV